MRWVCSRRRTVDGVTNWSTDRTKSKVVHSPGAHNFLINNVNVREWATIIGRCVASCNSSRGCEINYAIDRLFLWTVDCLFAIPQISCWQEHFISSDKCFNMFALCNSVSQFSKTLIAFSIAWRNRNERVNGEEHVYMNLQLKTWSKVNCHVVLFSSRKKNMKIDNGSRLEERRKEQTTSFICGTGFHLTKRSPASSRSKTMGELSCKSETITAT